MPRTISKEEVGCSGGDDPTPTPRTISKEEVGCSGGDAPMPRTRFLRSWGCCCSCC
ncbi:hypothetical protein LINPERPRIM_LOCUS600, partial [Linum perenne]